MVNIETYVKKHFYLIGLIVLIFNIVLFNIKTNNPILLALGLTSALILAKVRWNNPNIPFHF